MPIHLSKQDNPNGLHKLDRPTQERAAEILERLAGRTLLVGSTIELLTSSNRVWLSSKTVCLATTLATPDAVVLSLG